MTTYEDVFDIMQTSHTSLDHARDIKKNKAKLDQVYYGIPESCACFFSYVYVLLVAPRGERKKKIKFLSKWF